MADVQFNFVYIILLWYIMRIWKTSISNLNNVPILYVCPWFRYVWCAQRCRIMGWEAIYLDQSYGERICVYLHTCIYVSLFSIYKLLKSHSKAAGGKLVEWEEMCTFEKLIKKGHTFMHAIFLKRLLSNLFQ